MANKPSGRQARTANRKTQPTPKPKLTGRQARTAKRVSESGNGDCQGAAPMRDR